MENEQGKDFTNKGGSDEMQMRKEWSAPQLTAVSISDLTENMGSPGNDGSASSTLS